MRPVREQAALGIGDLIQRTAADALRPFVTQITGPLIRIIGERYPPQVKAAILQTLRYSYELLLYAFNILCNRVDF